MREDYGRMIARKELGKELSKLDWSPQYINYDMNKLCHILTKIILIVLDKIVPVKKIKIVNDKMVL